MRLPQAAVLAGAIIASQGVGAAEAGKAVFARGAVTGQAADGSINVLGKDALLHEGDVITTGRKSFAVLELADGTRMALRPETVFKVEQYRDTAGSESAVMRLFKGGLRTISGFIAKRGGDAYRMNTPVATIGIRGTELDVRLCDASCKADAEAARAQAPAAPAAPAGKVVGRVAFAKGEITGTGADQKPRVMALGAPLYEGDVVNTSRDGLAVLAFRDESRVTLSSNSGFQVEKAQFEREDPGAGSTVFRLLRGGLRAVTGLVGKRNPNNVRFNTPVATIGIRGTGFDLLCQGSCNASPKAQLDAIQGHDRIFGWLAWLIPAAHAQGAPPPGLFARVWLGGITMFFGNQQQNLDEGKTAFLNGLTGVFKLVPAMPGDFNPPRPDQVPVNQQQLFEVKETGDPQEGDLLVNCNAGHCSVQTDQGTTELGAGEGASVGSDGGSQRQDPSGVLTNDPYLKTADPNMAPLLDTIQPGQNTAPECQ
ncbi:MAG: FecR domain-containing protein [Gammaproteobacteria bacterium]